MTLREIPQSVSVITSQQCATKHQNARLRSCCRRPKTSRRFTARRAGYNYLFARGSRIANYQINGIPVADALADTGNANTAAYERVEVGGVAGLSGRHGRAFPPPSTGAQTPDPQAIV